MFSNNKIINHFKNLRLIEKLFIQGIIVTFALIIIQLLLDGAKSSFMSYMPPIGLVFMETINYGIQPLIIGVLNIIIIHTLYKLKGWQVGFWLNGIFLLLTFTTINLLIQTVWGLQFADVAVIDIILLSLPFGCIARFSNGGWSKPID